MRLVQITFDRMSSQWESFFREKRVDTKTRRENPDPQLMPQRPYLLISSIRAYLDKNLVYILITLIAKCGKNWTTARLRLTLPRLRKDLRLGAIKECYIHEYKVSCKVTVPRGKPNALKQVDSTSLIGSILAKKCFSKEMNSFDCYRSELLGMCQGCSSN